MKFIATLLTATSAVTLEGTYDADGNLLSYPRADGAIQFTDGQVGYLGGELLGPEDFGLGRNYNVFNFYGAVYGDVKGIADDDGDLATAVGADRLLAPALGGGLPLDAVDAFAAGLGGRLGGLGDLVDLRPADLALAGGSLGDVVDLRGAAPVLGGGLPLDAVDAFATRFGGAATTGLGGAGQQLVDQAGGALVDLGDGSGVTLLGDRLGGLTAVVDGGALEGAPARGTGLGGAAITSAEGGWCGYNATK